MTRLYDPVVIHQIQPERKKKGALIRQIIAIIIFFRTNYKSNMATATPSRGHGGLHGD